MKHRQYIAILGVGLGLAACGEVPFSVNPSDRDIPEASEPGSLPAANVFVFTSLDPNAEFQGMTPGTECAGSARISGAWDASLNFVECTGESGVSFWVDQARRNKFWMEPLDLRQAGDLSPYEATIGYRQVDGTAVIEWRTACTISLSSSIGYEDNFGAFRAVWTGNADCPDPATSIVVDSAQPDLGGQTGVQPPITIEGFSFLTDFAQTCTPETCPQ